MGDHAGCEYKNQEALDLFSMVVPERSLYVSYCCCVQDIANTRIAFEQRPGTLENM